MVSSKMFASALALVLVACSLALGVRAGSTCTSSGVWSSYGACELDSATGSMQRCKTWNMQYNSGGSGVNGGSWAIDSNQNTLNLGGYGTNNFGNLGMGWTTNFNSYSNWNFRRNLLAGCPSYGSRQCTFSGCQQGCQGTWTDYGPCTFNAAKGVTQKCKMFEVGFEHLLEPKLGSSGTGGGGSTGAYNGFNGDGDGYTNDVQRRSLQNQQVNPSCPKLSCTTDGCVEQKVDCVGSFSGFGSCQYDSVANAQKRCKKYSITTPATSGGQACPYAEGHEECTTWGCSQPVNCQGSYGPYGPCKLSSEWEDVKRCRTYSVTTPASNGGIGCPVAHNSKQCIASGCWQKINCVGVWEADFALCKNKNGQNVNCKRYKIIQQAANGGSACPYSQGAEVCETEGCAQPVDCQLGYSQWSSCSKNPQTKSNEKCREKVVVQNALNNGAPCSGAGQVECTTSGCAQAQDCVGDWEWSACVYLESLHQFWRTKTFKITQPALNGGVGCQYANGYFQNSLCPSNQQPLDCIGSWGEYGTCSEPTLNQAGEYGISTRCRTFTVETAAANNGHPCAANGSIHCTMNGCDQKVNCEGHWMPYQACSYDGVTHQNKKCKKYKVTTAAAFGGNSCPHTDGETSCTSGGCVQPVDCKFEWSNNGACAPHTDGSNKKCKTANIVVQAQHNGKACEYADGHTTCTTAGCGQPVDCVGSWEVDNTCHYNALEHANKSCKTYKITTPAQHGGEECPFTNMQKSCAKNSCEQPQDCAFTWTPVNEHPNFDIIMRRNLQQVEMDYTFGGVDFSGFTGTGGSWWNMEVPPICLFDKENKVNESCKKFVVTSKTKHNGLPCPHNDGYIECKEEGCNQPVDCMGVWGDYEACAYTSSGGHFNERCRTYTVVLEAQFGGQSCPFTNGEKQCTQGGCVQPIECKHEWKDVTDSCVVDAVAGISKKCKRVEITVQPAFGGSLCPHPEGYETCSEDGCAQPVNCVGAWTPYEECEYDSETHVSKQCKTYKVTTASANGGFMCPVPNNKKVCVTQGCQQPIDCNYQWSDYGDCKLDLDSMTNQRCKSVSILTQPAYHGKGCEYANGHKECTQTGCAQPVNCQGEWSEYEQCAYNTEKDENTRCKTFSITQPALNGGEECKFDDGVTSCTTAGCGQPIDCEHEWTPYGNCKYFASSQSNKRCRSFNIITTPDNNGEQCPHPIGYEECTQSLCPQPVDCEGSWQEYDECYHDKEDHTNKRCKIYKVTKEAAHNGAQCPFTDGETECTQGGCAQPVHCAYTLLSVSPKEVDLPENISLVPHGYGECHLANGVNQKCTYVHIIQEPSNHGALCPFPSGFESCTTTNCTQPVDCVGSWNAYDSCSYVTGSHQNKRCRTYSISTEAAHGGAQCPHVNGHSECTAGGCEQPIDCEIEMVPAPGADGEKCELHVLPEGTKARRSCEVAKVIKEPEFNGLSCQYNNNQKICSTADCEQPVDCVGNFVTSDVCKYHEDHANVKCSVYTVTTKADFGGLECPLPHGMKNCSKTGCEQPIDCQYVVNHVDADGKLLPAMSFSQYDNEESIAAKCFLDPVSNRNIRCEKLEVITEPEYNGKTCPSDGFTKCTENGCKQPVACEGEWTSYEECYHDSAINANKRCRSFKVTQEAVFGGPQCPHADGYTECTKGGCPQPQACESEWSEYDACEFSNAIKANERCRTLSITTFPENNGQACEYANGHKECTKSGCAQPVNCQGEWSEYEQCAYDTDADSNKRCRTFSITQPALNGGEECKFDDGVTSCTTAGCGQPIDCEHEWSAYGSCSMDAASQTNKRCRTFHITTTPDNNGEQCPNTEGESECTTAGCAQPVDCVGSWQEYESCFYDENTEANKRCRVFKVATEAAHGGAQCPHIDGATECTQGGCAQPVNCDGSWGDYEGECKFNLATKVNQKCRTFTITTQAANMGKTCLFLNNEMQCSPEGCEAPVDCEGQWGDFSTCSYDQASNTNKRCKMYSISTIAQYNGEQCPNTEGETECTTSGCAQPVDCVGSWEEYGDCEYDASNHENKACKFFKVATAAANGGSQCSHEDGERQCSTSECSQPINCLGSWSDLGSCAYDSAEHKNSACKVFTIEVEAANGGEECQYENNEESCATSVCDQPIDCVGEFVTTPNCTLDASTNKYVQCGTYRIVTPAAHGGQTCAYENGYESCEPCSDEKTPVDCEFHWVEQVTDECASSGVVRNCSVFTVTQEANLYGEQCAYESGHEICRSEECDNSGNGDSGSNQDGSDGNNAGVGGTSAKKEVEEAEAEVNTASVALMYGGIGLAALLCCCLPLLCYYRRKKRKQAALGQSVEGRKYSLLNYGSSNMVPMPVGGNSTMMANPFFGVETNGRRNNSMVNGVTFNNNPLQNEQDDAESSGFEATTHISSRGSMNEGFFNPMFVQQEREEMVGTLQQDMYAMYDYIEQMCGDENESMAVGEIKKEMQEAMLSWTQVEDTLIESEGQDLTQTVSSEDMEQKLQAIRQKLNRIEQSAFMCRDIKSEEKSSLSTMINKARGKLRRVSTVGGSPNMRPSRKTTMPTEWKQIKMKLKTVKALRGSIKE